MIVAGTTTSCPDYEQLDRLASDSLEGEARARAARHLESCESCRRVFDEFRANAPVLKDLETAIGDDAFIPPHQAPAPRLDGYDDLVELHRGGQGVVYAARRVSDGARVAIKLLLHGRYASPRERRRFEREIELTASIAHPGIVPMLASGVTDDGRLFLVTRFIDGLPLDQHLRQRAPDLAARLLLMEHIASAVSAAHLRGVLHRDLKPSNVLVDESGEPRLLDFGLAKSVIEPDTAATRARTRTGEFFGTLVYAAPEQLQGDPDAVDVRSDVYSLGVMLFESLTGRLPHPKGATPVELIRHISSQDAPRPSTLAPGLDDEIDTIVMACLDKEKDRRYQSAGELAADLRCYRMGEPLQAKRDSIGYMLRKQLSRHRGPVSIAAAAVIALVAFSIYAFWQANRYRLLAESEHNLKVTAETAKSEALAARADEEALRIIAEREAARSRAVTAFLADTFGMASPDVRASPDASALALLIDRADEVQDAFADDPAAEAAVRAGLGQAFYAHGKLELAQEQFSRALELRRTVVASTARERYDVYHPLVEILGDQGVWEHIRLRWEVNSLGADILREADQTLYDLRRAWGSISTQRDQDDAAQVAFTAMLDRAAEVLPPEDDRWLIMADQIQFRSVRARELGLLDPAVRWLTEARAILRRILPDTNTRSARTVGLLIRWTLDQGDFAAAEQLADESIRTLTSVLPDDHWFVAVNRAWRAEAAAGMGRTDEALATFRQSIPRILEGRGEGSPYAIEALAAQVRAATHGGGHAEQLPGAGAGAGAGAEVGPDSHRLALARALAMFIREAPLDRALLTLGPDHAALATALREFDAALASPGPEIGPGFAQVAAAARAAFADADPRAAVIADVFASWGDRYANADSPFPLNERDPQLRLMLDEVLRISRANPHRHRRKLAGTLWWLGSTCYREAKFAEGEAALREAIAVLDDGIGESWGLRSNARWVLGACLHRRDRFDEAEPLLIDGYEGLARHMGPLNLNTENAILYLVNFFTGQDRVPEAASWSARHLRRVGSSVRPDPGTFNTLAWAIVRHAEAPAADVALARLAIDRALVAQPDAWPFLNTLGAVQYRAGEFDAAHATLTRTLAMPASPDPVDLSFLAMACAKLGRMDEAREHLAALRDMINAAPAPAPAPAPGTGRDTAENRALLVEAEQVITEAAR